MGARKRLRHFAVALAASQLLRGPSYGVRGFSSLSKRVQSAQQLREVYEARFAFPGWTVDDLEEGRLERFAQTVTVYYPKGAKLQEVHQLVRQREPVNIAMERRYDEEKLQKYFGYKRGAYGQSSSERLLPNIAIYCQTPMQSADGQREEVHVVNVIGFAFDTPKQPDFQYFQPGNGAKDNFSDLIKKMSHMWEYIFFCAREKNLKRVFLSNVGGGAFASGLRHEYTLLKNQSLDPVLKRYPDIEMHDLQRIPDWVFGEGQKYCSSSLLVNAWDPWSIVGNGNAADNSLDGYFGRSTAMAVLCWSETNPYLRYQQVPGPFESGN